jgi:hypothetical protein
MRHVITLGLLALAAGLVGACGAQEQQLAEGDCVEELVWRGGQWAGHRHRPPLAERIDRTTTLACGKPYARVSIHRIPGVDPSVAVGVRRRGERSYLALGPGYVVQSPRHPFHRVLYGSEERPRPYDGLTCRGPRALVARVSRAPVGDERWLTVRAERPRERRFLRGRNVGGNLSIFAATAIDGLDRRGIPYVERGRRLRLTLRACRGGAAAEDGLRGLAFLVVDRMSAR